ncbi:hypothetical protein Leryth_001018 [Lithospermum erythrorhizon]|nr:hypothetical protein Leryth_001018 [Lithospermum erythrorhizon]
MSEMKNKNKRRLSFTLSFFGNSNSFQNLSKRKSPKVFEVPNEGKVGLGIVAAMHDNGGCHHDPVFAKKKASVIAISPSTWNLVKKKPSFEEMERCEEYTCVISHVGKNVVKKKEYFDGDFLGATEGSSEKLFGTSFGNNGDWLRSDLVDNYNFNGGQSGQIDFLSSCFLCKKKLHGLDIFMYRGETAFCSAECRYKQISDDEHETCSSRVMNPTDSFQCFSGVAAT